MAWGSRAYSDEGKLAPAAHSASAEQRLLIDQVDQLSASGQSEEAQQILSKLFDESLGRVIEAGTQQQAASLTTQPFFPLRQWVHDRHRRLLAAAPQSLASFRATNDESARAVHAEVAKSNDLTAIQTAAERYALTSYGSKLRFLLCDHYLERRWTIAAKQVLSRSQAEIRITVDPASKQNAGSVSWTTAWPQLAKRGNAEDFVRQWRSQKGSLRAAGEDATATDRELAGTVARLQQAAALEDSGAELEVVLAWSESMAKILGEPASAEIRQGAELARQCFADRVKRNELAAPSRLATFAGNAARNAATANKPEIGGWYTWTQKLDRHTSASDRTAGSKPRVAESELGLLAYHPVVYDGRVFINELRRIVAFDLKTGKPWPDVTPALPLFDSGISADTLLPLGYPRIGVPRGTLCVTDGCLYARMGSPITGWASREQFRDDNGSSGYVVGLDLRRQGKMLPGFPWRLTGKDFQGAEPEGCPLAVGSFLFIPVAQRDNVGISRFIVAIDRVGGQFQWRSNVLARGTVDGGQQANLVSHQLLSYAGGRLFYNTNLGSIACLDPLSGQVEWLVRYRGTNVEVGRPPMANRFLYRDLTPCLVDGNLVYCAPQDCAEIFALDAATGDLVWSTAESAADDVVQLLGIEADSLVVSGDRLLWLDRRTGRIQSRFPAGTTSGPLNALPAPRGIGRGAIAGGEVWWPTAREIYVFPASLAASPSLLDSPPIRRRVRLDIRGAEGGNLLVSNEWLLLSSPSRLFAFRQPQEKSTAITGQRVFGLAEARVSGGRESFSRERLSR